MFLSCPTSGTDGVLKFARLSKLRYVFGDNRCCVSFSVTGNRLNGMTARARKGDR